MQGLRPVLQQAVNAALDQAFREAEAILLASLGDVTLAALNADFHRRLAARGPHQQDHRGADHAA